MKTFVKTTMAAGLALGMITVIAGEAEAKRKTCALLGAKGTGITHPVATDQALWQLEELAKSYGGKSAGKAKTSCSYQLVISECTVSQRYCK